MPVTSVDSGAVTPTIGVESVLSTQTDPGVYVLVVDTGNLTSSDALTLTVKAKAKAGAPSSVVFEEQLVGGQNQPLKYSEPLPIETEIKVSLLQTAGTAREFTWNLLQVG